MRELKKGEKVDHFIVKELIGSGGMGQVYLVTDQRLAVDRAMKVISLTGDGFTGAAAEVSEYQQRFVREARTLARLRHQNVVPVHAFGEFEGNPYLVMTYFPGRDARRWLNEEKPTLERVRAVGVQIGSALEHAHAHGVLHRDLKLSNILVGENDEAMLIDFGLAKSKFDTNLTRTGKAMGTYSYLAPEYVKASQEGKPEHTVLTDLWAFGCVLYALTCRRPAFHGKDELRVLGLIQLVQFDPVKKVVPDVPDAWAAVIHALMEPEPSRRVQTATAAIAALRRVTNLAAPLRVLPPPPPDEDDGELDGVQVADVADGGAAVGVASDEELSEKPEPGAGASTVNARPANKAVEPSTLFSHESTSSAKSGSSKATPALAQPSFQQPTDAATSAKLEAKKKLVLPLAAAAAVLLVGGVAIHLAGAHGAGQARREYVDPDELADKERAAREVKDIDDERAKRADAPAPVITPAPQVAMFASDASTPPPAAPATQSQAPKGVGTSKQARGSGAVTTVAVAPVASNPWTERYGTRTSFNTSSSMASAAAVASSAGKAVAPSAGVRIPVHVKDSIASAPAGPVIATVDAPTKIGDVELPRGTEIHGTIAGSSGPRVLVQFTFAIADGKTLPLKGIALGADGRAGVPGSKNFGGGTGIAAAAGGAVAGAALDAAALLAHNDLLTAAVGGAAPSVSAKAGRLDNEEDLVVTPKDARFFVYVQSAA